MDRRRFIKGSTAAGLAMGIAQAQEPEPAAKATARNSRDAFWPGGARMVVSLSLQMEAGAQPDRGASGPWGALDAKYPDLPTEKWYEYGIKEGIPRLLDMYDRRKVKVTSHMVGMAVEKHPALAKEIVQRGHEPAAHSYTWEPIYSKTPAEERAAYQSNIQAIEKASGQRPVGFNAPGMRATPATFGILQDLGFLYHTDDLSRDEPFIIAVQQKPFIVVPYTFQLNDLQNFENRWRTCSDFAGELKSEFDALYDESAHKRRMISVSAHDRVAGRASRMRVIEDFIVYAQRHPGVIFMRKDEIARFALASPLTIRET
ncbi:MAG TPA: polysaccharide deacetylase family protein [Bryobacteraceae bacterium]|jgi:peptidoglycan/xylan/chitin deacetylase (PgdA/CDA1 family)